MFKPDTQKKSAAVAICHANGSYLSANQILSTIHNAYSLPKITIIFFISKMPAKKVTKAESNSKCDATKHIQGTPFEWRSLVFPTSFFALSPSMTLQHRLSHLWANRIMADEQIKEDVGEEMRTSILTMLLFFVYLS